MRPLALALTGTGATAGLPIKTFQHGIYAKHVSCYETLKTQDTADTTHRQT